MLLSAVAQDAFRQVRGGRLLFAELLRQPLQVCTMHRGKAPPKPARRRLWRTIPEARRDSRLSCRDIHQDGPRYPRQFGQPLTTLWSKDELTCRAQHLLGRQGQRSIQEERLVKARIMDERCAECRRARLRIGAYQIGPKLSV